MPKRSSHKAADPDAYVLSLVSANPNLLVPHYLMACFLYYVKDDPLLSDAAFDEIATRLADAWETVEHRHKALLDGDLLKTGFHIKDYPSATIHAAEALRRSFGLRLWEG